MSLFGAINTAVSGLTAQSTAFGNISEDVANSQTVGFKRVDTSFTDYLTTSTATANVPGAVVATPDYVNNIQGTVTQTDNPLGMAIAGQGFFAVSQPTGEANGAVTFSPQQFYTRAGDFSMNSTGYLVNSAGQYLNGWTVNSSTGVANQNALAPIEVNQSTYNPVATQNVTLSANLPATPAAGTADTASPLSSQITVYDSLGTAHAINLNWVKNSANNWTVQVQVPDAAPKLGNGTTANYTYAGSATVTFGASNATVPASGTINSVTAVVPVVPSVSGPFSSVSTLPAPSDSITLVKNLADGTIASYTEVDDDGTGSAAVPDPNGAVTTTTTFPVAATSPIGGVAGAPGVPVQVISPTTLTTSGIASDITTKTVAPDGTVTYVETNDSGAVITGTTVTTTTIPPTSGALTGGGSYKVGAASQAPATLSFTTNFGSGNQTINLNLGSYGSTNGVTQFAGSAYSLLGLTQDGVAPGSFSGVTTQDNGNVIVNYNNGQTRTIAQIPLVTFNAPDSLQSQNGQSFTATPSSGSPLAEAASTNGAGNLVTGSVEGSNVDIATEFTNLIVSQQAYSSNAKVVSTANQMLQATLQMIA
ncbi:MAG: flagellar hook-basal body complex protein [Rhodopila sp.]|jgi:flagellar hook protein FlgE